MRETENSLQLWFGAVGMLTLVDLFLKVEKAYIASTNPMAILSRPPVAISLLISLAIVIAYLFVAIKFRDLIVTSPNAIRAVLIVSMVYLAIVVTLLAVFTHSSRTLFWPGIELAATVYLLLNVNRIVKELRE
ncbi:MAG TPA: hypothetical protein VF651_00795 [Gammaproteobacteria bacterium]